MVFILRTNWNSDVTTPLASSAESYLKEKKIETQLFVLPGALELPFAVKWLWSQAQRTQIPLEGVVVCGCVIKGETYHFELVANESARALMNLSVELRLPVGHAILCVTQKEQALARARPDRPNRGTEAAEAVYQMMEFKKKTLSFLDQKSASSK